MYQIKDLFQNKRILIKIGVAIISVIVLIFAVVFVIKLMNRKISYTSLEDQLVNATSNYLKAHPEYYPTKESPTFTIAAETLVNEKYIKKEIGKLVKDTCSAQVEVHYQNDAYQVKPMVSCTKYESLLLYDKVLLDNPVVTDGNGLYDLNEMLVFRGDKPTNYIKYHNFVWRIVKMDPTDSSIYLILDNLKDTSLDIWDNRYNSTEESKHGINDYSVSIISDTLTTFYQESFTGNDKSSLLPIDVCIGKRSDAETVKDGSVECSNIMSDKKYISLLPLYDYLNASTDYQCRTTTDRGCANYNYLVNKTGKWWTLTADGSRGTKVYGINYTGAVVSDYADSKKYVRFVVKIDGNLIYRSGNGTSDNPYTFI